MRHFPRPLFGAARTFTDTVTIQFEGSPKCGSDFNVEVEFTAMPDHWDADICQGEAGEREIIAIRPFEYLRTPAGLPGTERRYFPTPDWLIEHLKDCIDVDTLDVDWSDF